MNKQYALPNDRSEKIKLLRDIMSGDKTLKDLKPVTYPVIWDIDEGVKYSVPGKEGYVTKNDFDNYVQKNNTQILRVCYEQHRTPYSNL